MPSPSSSWGAGAGQSDPEPLREPAGGDSQLESQRERTPEQRLRAPETSGSHCCSRTLIKESLAVGVALRENKPTRTLGSHPA